MGIEVGLELMTMVSGKNVTAAVWPLWMHFVVSLHYISPSTNPLHIMPIGQRAIFQRPMVFRKRQEEHNKGAKEVHERKFCGP